MKLFMAILTFSGLSFAQTQPTNPPPPPPATGPAVSPSQAQPPPPGKPNFSPEDCQRQAAGLKNLLTYCLDIKDRAKRQGCFAKNEQSVAPACQNTFRPVRDEIYAKEEQRYPRPAGETNGPAMNNGKMQLPMVQDSSKNKKPSRWNEATCKKKEPQIRKMAEGCLKSKKEDVRRKCFDKVGKSFPNDFWEDCRPMLDPLKAEMEAKEKEMYPNQGNTISNNNGHQGGPQHGSPNNKGPHQGDTKKQANVDCPKAVGEARKASEVCLRVPDAGARKKCFDTVGDKLHSVGASEGCSDMLNQLKSEITAKEMQMYPGSTPSIN